MTTSLAAQGSVPGCVLTLTTPSHPSHHHARDLPNTRPASTLNYNITHVRYDKDVSVWLELSLVTFLFAIYSYSSGEILGTA